MNTPIKIMIVEDEAIVALDLEQQLQDLGYKVTAIVASGEAAVEAAYRNTPDLILMDIQLQTEMDGITTAGDIKAKHLVPIVYLTASADKATLYRARSTEPHGYLVKPFSAETLRTTIEMALYKFQSEMKLIEYTKILEQQKKMLELLHSLVMIFVHDDNLEDLLRTACPALINVLHLPYTFAVLLGQSHADTLVFECVSGQSKTTTTQPSAEAYQACQKHFTRDKPWILQSNPTDHCIDVLKLFQTHHFTYQLYILPLVVDSEVIGVIGLGSQHTEEISVNNIRAAWSVVSEIGSVLEGNSAPSPKEQITDVLFHRNIDIVITDIAGTVEYVNPAFEQHTGYFLQETKGTQLLSLPLMGSKFVNPKSSALQTAITQGTSWYGSLDLYTKNGTAINTKVAFWPVVEEAQISNTNPASVKNPIDVPYITHFVLLFQMHNPAPDNE